MQGEGEYTISDFIQSLSHLTLLSYQEPKDICHDMWTFWSKEDDDCMLLPDTLQEIKYSLRCGIRDCSFSYLLNILVQFWAPMTVGGRCVLKTSNQPFGLNRFERGLCEYRKHCMSLQFTTTSFQDDDESVIGRVFTNKQMESTPNVEYYSIRDYPHLEIAVKCGIRKSLALPLLQPNNGECVGVLELVDRAEDISFPTRLLNSAEMLLKLSPLEAHLPIELQMRGRKKPEVPEEIIEALEAVCTTLRLPLAQIWIPDRPSRASYFWTTDVNFSYYSYYDFDSFNSVCLSHHLRKDQGVVGKAHLFHKPCYCRDVSQLPIAEYPLSHYARKYGLTGCFAISLLDYVLEFFLPPLNTTSGDPRTDLESIFTMTTNHLLGFEICLGGGRGPGEESYVEVVNISIHDGEQDSFKIFQTFGIQPLSVSSLQNETREEQVQNNVTDEAVVVDDDNDVALACLDNRVEMLEEGRENELVQLSDDESAMEAGRNNEVNVVYSEQNGVASTSSGRISGREETSEREYIRTEGSLSREDLTQHFGKKLDDAAAFLGVSRSTMKRACRVKGIKKWPFPKRKKVKPSPSNLKHINKRVRDGTKQIPKFDSSEPSCSHPPTQTTGVVAHTIPNVTPKQDEGNVTIKATYGDKMIRFPLTFSSRKADLMEKVTLRLPLKDGAFYIKYEDDDGDWIFVACDEDLEECIRISKGKSKIKMLVQPITNEAP